MGGRPYSVSISQNAYTSYAICIHVSTAIIPTSCNVELQTVIVECIGTAEAVRELCRVEELINNTAESGGYGWVWQRSTCLQGSAGWSGPAGRLIGWCPQGNRPQTPALPVEA